MLKRLAIFLLALPLLSCGDSSTSPDDVSGDNVVVITSATFNGLVLQNSRPSMVEFYLPTCSHCQAMVGTVRRLAERYAGRALVGKADVSVETALGVQMQVEYVPAFVFFKDGVEKTRLIGEKSEAELSAVIDSLLVTAS
jgi:thioredoxin 1